MTRAMLIAVAALALGPAPARAPSYDAYEQLLARFVRAGEVDYEALTAQRASLDVVVASLDDATAQGEPSWARGERLAFWINAYNILTLRAIVDHYPIQSRWLSLAPKNSIRQIDGVWTKLTWRVAGRTMTLDRIEHEILRPLFQDFRIHFAINCGSKSCPALGDQPYVPDQLDAQLDAAARRYLAGPSGLQVVGDELRVSSIFKWYADDFVRQARDVGQDGRSPVDRAVLETIIRYGPPAAAALAGSRRAKVGFLGYDWSLNDVAHGQ